MTNELLPCPFCGGKNIEYDGEKAVTWITWIHCLDCTLSAAHSYDRLLKEDADAETAMRWNRRANLGVVAEPVAHGNLRKGAERLEATRWNAEYWLNAGRKEPSRDKAVMYVEQSSNAWRNAAYGLAEELANASPATPLSGKALEDLASETNRQYTET